MNIHIDNFDVNKLDPSVLNFMDYLHKYLDEGWKIYKKNHSYIVKNKKCKMSIHDKMVLTHTYNPDDNQSHKYILCFIYNVLNNGWRMKKSNENYIFIKNHEGKKEIFSNNYINTFIKENFNSYLIK
jgi:hypothetical protein